MIRNLAIFIMMNISVPYIATAQVSVFQNITTLDGLPSNYVFQIDEDENGFLWAATDKGLAFYNGFKWQNYGTDNLLPGNYVNQVVCSGKGGLWMSISNKGIYYFDFRLKTISQVSEENVAGLVADKEGTLSYSVSTKQGPVIYLVKADNPTRPEMSKPQKKNQPTDPSLFLNFKDTNAIIKADSLYFSDSYLYRLQPDGNILKKKLFDQGNAGIYVTSIREGFWITDHSTKVFFINKDFTKTIEYNTRNGLITPLISSIYISNNNQTLICTMGAGIQVLLPEGNLAVTTNNAQVSGIAFENNLAYAVTEKNLFVMNLLQGSLQHKFDLPEKQIMHVNVIDGKIYVSSLFGFSIYEIKRDQLVKKEFVAFGTGISSVIKVNNSFITSSFGSGIIDADTLRKSAQRMPGAIKYPLMERMQSLRSGFTAYNYEDGVYFFDTKNVEVAYLNTKNGLLSNNIYHVMEDGDRLWISTAKGISMAENFRVIRSFPINFPNSTDRCIACFKDSSNRLWMVSNKRLWRFDGDKFIPTNNSILIENKNDQIIEAVFNPETNSLLVGTNQQLFLLKMDKIYFDSSVKKPALLQAAADGERLNTASLNSFSYNTDVLTFSFKPTFNTNFTESRIYYNLEGFSKEYQQMSDSLTLQFSKLRPGNYTLFAKTVNADGFESEATPLTRFTIEKPFWQTWWFSLLFLIASVFITYTITWRNSRKRQLQLEKDKKMAEQLVVERERISKELHDNLGANLVTMIAQTDNIETNLLNNKTEEALKKTQELSNHSRETVNILRETIWAVQENEHSLDDFVLRVKNYLQRTLPVKNIDWHVTNTGSLNNNLSAAHTLNLFRIIQETTQNIIKHSGAKSAAFDFNAALTELSMTISDNGVGFNSNDSYRTNGLKNIKSRTEDLGGIASFVSTEKNGTTISITITTESL